MDLTVEVDTGTDTVLSVCECLVCHDDHVEVQNHPKRLDTGRRNVHVHFRRRKTRHTGTRGTSRLCTSGWTVSPESEFASTFDRSPSQDPGHHYRSGATDSNSVCTKGGKVLFQR